MKNSRLKILFDANPLMGNRTGIGHYTARLVYHIAAQCPDTVELTGYYYNFLGRKAPPSSPKAPNISYRPIFTIPGPVVNLLRRFHIEVPIEILTLKRSDFILYPNYLSHPSLFQTPNAPVIHDLTFYDYPASGSDKNIRDLNRFVPRVIRRASFVMTVSEFSKQRIIDKYHIPEQDVVTTFIPPHNFTPIDEVRRRELLHKQGIDKPYMFFIGTMEPRKNIGALLDAYTLLPTELRNKYSLVLAGKIDWKYQETKAKLEKLQAEDYDIHYLGYVDDETQAALYQGARLFTLTSSYEGFGMQIVEALQAGIPCAVSDIPVFHEVGGNMVSYFNHKDSKHIATTIASCLTNSPPRASDLQHSLATQPSWVDVTSKVMERIEHVVKRKQA